MASLADVVFDCRHPASLARFWAAALDDYAVAPYDAVELERLARLGVAGPEDDPTVLVEAGDGPRLWFQAGPEPKASKNRVHLDLRASDAEAEAGRLEALGARRALDQPNASLIVMHDPEGNEFCVLRSAGRAAATG